ncbi:hypothetical protein BJX65DRAFT_302881 [Aspergillus insuetus]
MAKRKWAELAAAVSPMPACSLESISLFGRLYILPNLATVVDLSCVRSLEIQVIEDSGVLEQAASVLNNPERLFLTVWQVAQNRDLRRIYDRVVTAIRTFHPLKHISLCGLSSITDLKRIIEVHGRTLQCLVLTPELVTGHIYNGEMVDYRYPELTNSEIAHLNQACPNLQELRLPFRRSAGSPRECNMYRALGQFRNLHTLILDLQFNSKFQLDRPIYLSETRTSFINAATDEKLALDI